MFVGRLARKLASPFGHPSRLYAGRTCVHLRLLAGPFGQGFILDLLLDCAKLPTLYNSRSVYKTLLRSVMFKVKHSLVPVSISDLLHFKNTQYNLRNSDFELPRFETFKFERNSIKYVGPLIWSKLPRHLRMIE